MSVLEAQMTLDLEVTASPFCTRVVRARLSITAAKPDRETPADSESAGNLPEAR